MLRRILAASFVLAAFAQAVIIHVPGDQPTIQRAINVAASGDTILVAAGTYYESFDYLGKDLLINGLGGAANTTVSGDSLSPVVTMNGGETTAAVLKGFTIKNGLGGIRLQGSSPTIIACRVSNNQALRGGGIYCENSSPVLSDCAILDNSANAGGGGLYCDDGSAPTLTACRIEDNAAMSSGGGLYSDSSTSSPSLVSCVVRGNTSTNSGGGLQCRSSTISECVIEGNSADDEGGGVNFYGWGMMSPLRNCRISGNSARYGGGLYCAGDSISVFNTTIYNNTAYTGGGIYLRDGSPLLENNTITANSENGVYITNGSPVFINCVLWANTPVEIVLNGSSPDVSYCDVQGDYPGEGNFGLNPRFVTYRGFDYLLHPLSPCIDAGDPSIEDGISDWHPRWPNRHVDGPRSDMGAYGGPGNIGWLP